MGKARCEAMLVQQSGKRTLTTKLIIDDKNYAPSRLPRAGIRAGNSLTTFSRKITAQKRFCAVILFSYV